MTRGEYWNAEIETMPADARRRLEAERLREQIDYNHRSSAFYRETLDSAGVKPSEIPEVAHLALQPLDLRAGRQPGQLQKQDRQRRAQLVRSPK